jgi:hypothetical protein
VVVCLRQAGHDGWEQSEYLTEALAHILWVS